MSVAGSYVLRALLRPRGATLRGWGSASTSPRVRPRGEDAPPAELRPAWAAPVRGTWDDPVPIASSIGAQERIVACSGRAGAPHPTQYLVVRAGAPSACGHPKCRQVFVLAEGDGVGLGAVSPPQAMDTGAVLREAPCE